MVTGPERINKIVGLFKLLSSRNGGVVTLEYLGRQYDAGRQIEVANRRRTEKEVFEEYIKSWSSIDPLAAIPEERFVEYYQVR